MDIAGNVSAVWGEDDGTTRKIVSNRYLNGMWGATPVTHASTTNQAAFNQWRAATDGSGTVTIVWNQQMNPAPPSFVFTINVNRLQ